MMLDSSNQDEGIGLAVSIVAQEEMQSATGTADNYSMQEDLHQLSDAGISKKDSTCNGLLEGCPEKSSPILIEGREVNLLQLWTDVLAHGGYQKVTDTSIWPSLSERLGFEKKCGAAVKLVYAKHLNMYESRLMMKNGLHFGEDVDCSASKSVEESSTGLICSTVVKGGQSNSPDSSVCHTESNPETPSKRRRLSYVKEQAGGSSSMGHQVPNSTEGADAFAGMIEWIKRLALNPGDPKKGQGPRGSKRNEAWLESCSTMVMKVRRMLWGRKELIHYGGWSGNMAKQRIPPKEYYKDLSKPNPKALEKLRANQTRAMKCGLHLPGDMSDGHAVRSSVWWFQTPSCTSLGSSVHGIDGGLDLSSAYLKSMNEALSIGYILDNKIPRKRIPIGPYFQAQIPQCIGKEEEVGKETDGEQLSTAFGGTLVWPIPGSQGKMMRVGIGRPLTCSCRDPMSVDCVRLHIWEEREKLKKELGEAYDSWGFDDMGEIVADRWTKEEEHAFDLTVKMNPASLGKNFWDELLNALPSKSVKELVSYYFNVFVVRRRAIENRTMPDSIDSDDDERELVISGNGNPLRDNAMAGYWQDPMMPRFFGLSHCQELWSSATSCPPIPHGEK